MGTVPKTGNLNVKSGSSVCWAWRVGSPRCFWVLALSWPVALVRGLVGSPAVRLLWSVLFWRASPGRSCFCCVGAPTQKLAFPLDVWQCRSPSILVAPFLGTHARVSVRVLLWPRFSERRTMYCSCRPSWFGLRSEPQSYQEGWIFARGRSISKFALEGRPAEHARVICRLSWQRARSVPVRRCFFTEINSITASGCRAESGCSSRRYFHKTLELDGLRAGMCSMRR